MEENKPVAPVDQETGLTQEQIDRELRRRDAVASANADPLPGPLADAFDPEPLSVGHFTVRPYVPFDMVVLRKLESPLLKQMAELAKPEEERRPTEFDDMDEAVMIFQFITPIERVRDLVQRGARAFRAAAEQEIAFNPRINAVLQAQLVQAVTKQFLRAFSTVINYGGGESGKKGPFPTAQPEVSETDSAPGSTTSASL